MSDFAKKLKNFILDWILPPKVAVLFWRLRNPPLPQEDIYESERWTLWRECLSDARNYYEYGVGKSTLYASKNSESHIYGIDSNQKWVDEVNDGSIRSIELEHVDLGEVGSWGAPISYERWENFRKYISPKKLKFAQPDLVLIDGRFRVACFLYVLATCQKGTKIIFDDYPKRAQYHIVERFIKPKKVNSYQALFEIPDSLNKNDINKWIENFYFVMS